MKKGFLKGLVANQAGEIFDLEGYAAVGAAGDSMFQLTKNNTIEIPFGSELMYLPDRFPILYNLAKSHMETLYEDPYNPGEPIFPVAAFNSPGYVLASLSPFEEDENAGFLPLFAYGAVGWMGDGFRTSAILVDSEPRQDLRQMNIEKVKNGVKRFQKKMPGNRLREHLERCALVYGCPAAKNLFLKRYEAPLPTSRACNARCMGCLSLQDNKEIPASQNRIDFTPSPEEIAMIADEHIRRVKNPVVSFGQGCEGDPLLAFDAIEPAVRMIRNNTPGGTINMNSNASKPELVEKLFEAGLNGMRVSMNSARKDCYEAYFRPKGYEFENVLESIKVAKSKGGFVAINYLNTPGFTDTDQESEAFFHLIENSKVDMIQWRNLNFDPKKYFEVMNNAADAGPSFGMKTLISQVRKRFPKVKHGYFNPAKENY